MTIRRNRPIGPRGDGDGVSSPTEPTRQRLQPRNRKRGGRRRGGQGILAGGRNRVYGAMGGFRGVRVGEAASLVNAQLKPEIRQVQHDIQKQRRETQHERGRARREYTSAVGDISHLYDETRDYTQFQNDKINQNFDALTSQTNTAQNALMQHLQGTQSQAMSATNDDLARLGLVQAGGQDMGFTNQLSADSALMNQQGMTNNQNNLANINAMHQNSGDLGNLLLGMNAGGRTAAMGRAANAKSDALFEAEATKKDAVEQLKRSLKDLRMSRPDLVRQMMEQMVQSRWGQYMDQSQLALSREELNMQRAAQRAYSGGSSYGGGGYATGGRTGGGGGSGTGGGGGSGDANGAFNDLVKGTLGGRRRRRR